MFKKTIAAVAVFFLFITTGLVYAQNFKGTLVYSRLTDGYWQIWNKDLGGDKERQLTFSKYDKRSPVVSRGQNQVVFRTSNGRIFSVDKDTAKEKRLFERLGYLADPSWVTGQRLLFVRYRSDSKDDSDIWTANIEGDTDVKVLNDAVRLQYDPAISADKQRIAYVSGQDGNSHHIWLMDADGKNRKQLTRGNYDNIAPCFSPDGKTIIFASNRTGDYEIWQMGIDGNDPVQLTEIGGFNSSPAFSPSGEYICFVSNGSGDLQIWIMDKNGENAVQVTRGAECVDPFWY